MLGTIAQKFRGVMSVSRPTNYFSSSRAGDLSLSGERFAAATACAV
jgi:hypothetical protein